MRPDGYVRARIVKPGSGGIRLRDPVEFQKLLILLRDASALVSVISKQVVMLNVREEEDHGK